MAVTALGYIELAVQDVASWVKYGTEVLGLMIAHQSDSRCEFRMDSEAWRISVVGADADQLSAMGLEVGGPEELSALRKALVDAGYDVRDANEALKDQRKVADLFICEDPDGLPVEIYWGRLRVTHIPFASPVGVSGFVAEDQGLGHVLLTVTDIVAARKFYQNLLGFKLSDTIGLPVPGGALVDAEFFHCNPRHHTIALFPFDIPKRLLHFMLQAKSVDDVGYALDRAQAAGTQITHSLGRHTNDEMLSFYMKSPSGAEIEFGCGALEISPGWRVIRHELASSWGHKPVNP